MFGVCYLLLESTHSGAFEPTYRFDPIRLYRYSGDNGFTLMVAEGIFVLFVLGFFVKMIKKMTAQGCEFFFSLWNWVDVGIVVCSIISLGFYVLRMRAADDIGHEITETNGNTYVKAQVQFVL